MNPATLNLSVYQGDTFRKDLTFTTNGVTPINITGYTLTAQYRVTVEATAYVAFTCAIVSGVAGTATVSLTGTQTAAIVANGVWDLQWVTGAGDVQTVLAGVVRLGREVTR